MDVTTLFITSCLLSAFTMVLMVIAGFLLLRFATGGLTDLVNRVTGGGDPEKQLDDVHQRDRQVMAQAQEIRQRKQTVQQSLDFESAVARYRQGRPLNARQGNSGGLQAMPSLNRQSPAPSPRPQSGFTGPSGPPARAQNIPDANPLQSGGDFDSFQPPALRRRRDSRRSDDYQEIYDDQDGGDVLDFF